MILFFHPPPPLFGVFSLRAPFLSPATIDPDRYDSRGVRLSPPHPRGVTEPLIICTDAVEKCDVRRGVHAGVCRSPRGGETLRATLHGTPSGQAGVIIPIH